MSNKSLNRMQILDSLIRKEITQLEAASLMKLNPRQVRRIMASYRKFGPVALVHKGVGKPSNRKVKDTEIATAVSVLKTPLYHNFGPTFAHEKLTESNLISFGVDTLRHVMTEHKLWIPKKVKQANIHQFRERMAHFGDMEQIDGSPYDWLESRPDPITGAVVGNCTLLVMIDDAGGRVKLRLASGETTREYFKLMERYLLEEGKPGCLYSDKDSVFTVNEYDQSSQTFHKPSARDADIFKTQFERAMETLEIRIILANSPQAKGRVENANGTLQDRLVKEMRLRDICTIEAANAYLPTFEQSHNQKFGVSPKNSTNTHRPLTTWEKQHLREILAFHYTRTLSKNLTCQLDNTVYQIQPERTGYYLRSAKVNIIQTIAGETIIKYMDKILDYQTIKLQPKTRMITVKQLDQLAKQSTHTPTHIHTFWEKWAENGWNNYDQEYQLP